MIVLTKQHCTYCQDAALKCKHLMLVCVLLINYLHSIVVIIANTSILDC